MFEELLTPAVIIDLDVADKNIAEMIARNNAYNIAHRPHMKIHKSIYFAKKQIEAGCKGITCAKLSEAEVMCDGGIDDIFLAYTVIGEKNLERLYCLSKRIKIRTIVNSLIGAEALSRYFEKRNGKIDVLIEVDGGINRGGLKCGQPALEFAEKIRNFGGLNIVGLMYYGGLIYNAEKEDQIAEMTKKEHDDLTLTARLLKEHGFNMLVLSAGSTYSAKYPQYLEGLNEVRSGNYIYNDCSLLSLGLIGEKDCALNVLSTVVAKPDENTLIIDAGSKSLTTDGCHNRPGYGYVIEDPKLTIYKLNEEHGFVHSDNPTPLNVGDKLRIIPNHSCVISNLVDQVYGFRKGKLERMITVDARGKNY